MERYDSYKDSGVEWIGEIPEHWNMIRNQFFLLNCTDTVGKRTDEFVLLTLSKRGVCPRDLEAGGKFPSSFDAYKIVQPGNVVFCLFDMDETPCTVGLSSYKGMITGAYDVYAVQEKADARFVYYAYYSADTQKALKPYYKSLRKTIAPSEFAHIKLQFPPLIEQKSIADYLDRKILEIDSLVQKTEKSIELLQEYRKSVISEAVTKGPDPNVPMKDSGVEWIGEIPEKWNLRRMKFLASCKNGLTYSPENIVTKETGVLVLRSSNIKNGKLIFDDNVYVDCKLAENYMVEPDSILVCSRNGSRSLIGKSALIPKDLLCSFGAFMMLIKPSCIAKYFYYILNSELFTYYLGSYLTSTVNQLTVKNFNSMILPFSSNINEQTEIADYLDKKTSEIDSLIEKKKQLVEKLQEYRKSLISECVTGKVKVPGVE